MSQVIGAGPFPELNLCDDLWAHSNRFLHFLRSESLTPSAGRWLGKVEKGHRSVFKCLVRSKTSRRDAGTRPALTRAA